MHNKALQNTIHLSDQRESHRLPSRLVTPLSWDLKGLQIIKIQTEHHRNSYRGQGRGAAEIKRRIQRQFFHVLSFNPRCTSAGRVIRVH